MLILTYGTQISKTAHLFVAAFDVYQFIFFFIAAAVLWEGVCVCVCTGALVLNLVKGENGKNGKKRKK